MNYNLVKPTLVFTFIGLFIPGFTAIGILGVQMLLNSLGIECKTAWVIVWVLTTIAGLVLPFLFYRHLSNISSGKSETIKFQLLFFNIFEYIFIQSSLTPLFTDGRKLCYGKGGKMELN